MRTCVLDLPGLCSRLVDRLPAGETQCWFANTLEIGRASIRPVLPAVTMSVQATFTTGKLPQEHGIIANGLPGFRVPALRDHFDLDTYAEFRRNVSFWEQSNQLLAAPRVWKKNNRKTAMLFIQSSMQGAADVVVTPKPAHTPDGRTVSDCWSSPPDLYSRLKAQIGDFPLHHYWGPMAGMPSSEWIIAAARLVWEWEPCDLHWVYIPHMDYDLQRLGPDDPKCVAALSALLGLLGPLVNRIRADGGRVVVLGEYGLTSVKRSAAPNAAFAQSDLLVADGRGEVDYDRSRAFAMVDHQVAHVYCRDSSAADQAERILRKMPEVDTLHRGDDRAKVGLNCDRAGDLVAFTHQDAWFEYRWWNDWSKAPAYAWTVDIHSKPGYDPTELFMDMPKRRVRADQPELVKGSHGALPKDPADWPIIAGIEGLSGVVQAPQIAALV